MGLQIRQLGPNDVLELLDLLREAAVEEPLAFVTSPEDDFISSTKSVREHLEPGPLTAVFGAFDRDLVGMLWFAREERTKVAHKALIWRTYVRKESRGRGIGGKLLEVAINHGRTLKGLAAIWLCVSDKSPVAKKLYERHGFRVWGVEPDSFRADGESARLYYMTLHLK
jgi:ribosomal protein S18 acetylase RimI-like enzyme